MLADLKVGQTGHADLHKAIRNRVVTVHEFGAVGDGVTDDTAAITSAMAACPLVHFLPGRMYKAGKLTIPSNVTLDLGGATLKASLAASWSASIGIKNGTITGSVTLDGIDRLVLDSLTFLNVPHVACFVTSVSNGWFDRLSASGTTGNAFAFGNPDKPVTNSHFGSIEAHDILAEDGGNFPGNPFVSVLQDCQIDSIRARNTAAGIKIYGPSRNVTIGQVLFADGTSENSGLKVQGDATYTPSFVSVGQVLATDNAGAGLYLEKCADVTIGSYVGVNNATLGTYPDVWVGGLRSQIGQVRTIGAGGIAIRPDAVGQQIGQTITA